MGSIYTNCRGLDDDGEETVPLYRYAKSGTDIGSGATLQTQIQETVFLVSIFDTAEEAARAYDEVRFETKFEGGRTKNEISVRVSKPPRAHALPDLGCTLPVASAHVARKKDGERAILNFAGEI
eukprot:3440998-Rhodomonas_salina.1